MENLEYLKKKADILISALPYIRDYSGKIIVIEYDCGEYITGIEEQKLMQDIVLLSSIGMKPIVVHSVRKGMDMFRENKRIANMLESCGRKAIGICGIDEETLEMTLSRDYIPVIVPNDIDNETQRIDAKDVALDIAIRLQAEKLIYLGHFPGIFRNEDRNDVYPRLTVAEVKELSGRRPFPDELAIEINRCVEAVEHGVARGHLLDGRIEHILPIEMFDLEGAGTVIIKDTDHLYAHEVHEELNWKKETDY